jgi:hypothetical protein
MTPPTRRPQIFATRLPAPRARVSAPRPSGRTLVAWP